MSDIVNDVRLAFGPIRKPFSRFQSVGSASGVPVIPFPYTRSRLASDKSTLFRLTFINRAKLRLADFRFTLVRFILLRFNELRFASGPRRKPFRVIQPAGRLLGLPTIFSARTPLRSAPLRSALVRFD